MASLPDIYITHDDLGILSGLVQTVLHEGRVVAASRLMDELYRARIVSPAELPANCLTLYAPGRYLKERSGAVRDVTLIPGRSITSRGIISVLTVVGTHLLGLTAGQSMSWTDPAGRVRTIRLLAATARQPRAV